VQAISFKKTPQRGSLFDLIKGFNLRVRWNHLLVCHVVASTGTIPACTRKNLSGS